MIKKIWRDKRVKLLLKLLLTGLALYIVYRKIDVKRMAEVLFHAHIGWLILAVLAFAVSKVISSFRLNHFFRAIKLYISERYNLRLYWVGMFYNLFLPGGIGGDGYKVYILNKFFTPPLPHLLSAVLLDRISGVVALGFLAFLLGIFSSAYQALPLYTWVVWAGLLLIYPAYYVLVRLLFQRFRLVFYTTNLQSLGVQLFQLICAFFVLQSTATHDHTVDYLVLFLLSSVVAAMPITIGGVGARELVFIFGYTYLPIDKDAAVAFSVLFFLVSVVNSLFGSSLDIAPPTHADITAPETNFTPNKQALPQHISPPSNKDSFIS